MFYPAAEPPFLHTNWVEMFLKDSSSQSFSECRYPFVRQNIEIHVSLNGLQYILLFAAEGRSTKYSIVVNHAVVLLCGPKGRI